jgi:ribulose-bisphosphate carboxylase large chain
LRFVAVYRVASDAASIEARAQGIAIEQSIEAPLEAVRDDFVRREIVGEVGAIRETAAGSYEVEIALAADTVGADAGQLLNMLYGNSSLQADVELIDFRLPEQMLARFPGPGQGIAGLRVRVGANGRALTCVALKPQGLPPAGLAALAEAFALGGVDYIKDDHGLADQAYAPFAERVEACAAACRRAADKTGRLARYGRMREQIALAREAGLDAVMIAPMLAGLATAQALREENRDLVFLAHPTMGGAARIAPPALQRLFRLVGGDVCIFPNFGGRFGYSQATCRALAEGLRAPWGAFKAAAPTPAGGMTTARVAEIMEFYGRDTMLLIGGALLASPPDRLVAETQGFVRAVTERGETR